MSDALVKTKIDSLASGGAGLARLDGKSLFTEGTIPGETVLCRLAKDHGSWLEADLLEVTEPSPGRVDCACDYAGVCGGCGLQHMSYEAQLEAKAAMLTDAFRRIVGFEPAKPKVLSCTPWEYRNRMQFHAIRKFDKNNPDAYCGLKAKKSTDIIAVTDCPVADPGIRSLLTKPGKEAKGVLVSPLKDRVTVYARDGLLLSEANMSRGKTAVLGKNLALDAGVFFQSNGAMLEKLAADIAEIAGNLAAGEKERPAADIYCGVGTFAAFFGHLFQKVDMVEENKAALALARLNTAGLENTAFYAMRAENWAKTAGLGRYGFAVADPPRQGMENALVRRLAESGSAVFAYVSCNPATLARDSKTLLSGYELSDLRLYDFYPQTAHIESLAVFTRRKEGR